MLVSFLRNLKNLNEFHKEFEEQCITRKFTNNLDIWKYTSLNQIIKEDYTVFSKKKNVIDFKRVKDIIKEALK